MTVIDELHDELRGQVLGGDDRDYDRARSVWNAMVDRRPEVIARCTGTADVAAAVRFARTHDLEIAVRGGGHNIAGLGVCEGGMVIDLSAMSAVTVDPLRRRAIVQGGALWGMVDRETQLHGLATPSGIISTTGVGGLTLGGGFGWLSRMHGLTIDNLSSAQVVTADGDVVTASDDSNADLFWGLRGGGGNFGVVTSFEFELHELGPDVLFGPTVYALDDATDALRNYRDFAAQAPRACAVFADLVTAPPLPFLPVEVHGTKVLLLIQFYAGDPADGEKILDPIRSFGNPLGDGVMVRPYVAAQSVSDGLYEKGLRNYWKGHNMAELSDDAIDILVAAGRDLPTPMSDILIHQLGGAINDVACDATAYPHRDVQFSISPGTRWDDPTLDDGYVTWVRNVFADLAPHATGSTYSQFIGDRAGSETSAYGPNLRRLREVKQRWDPDNVFHHNQNVEPSGDDS